MGPFRVLGAIHRPPKPVGIRQRETITEHSPSPKTQCWHARGTLRPKCISSDPPPTLNIGGGWGGVDG
eukprot:8764104-Pyramimonas_sp.AAC.1